MKKIGIMGGTFNPIHYGHLLLAENAYYQFELDKVYIMPTNHPQYRTISSGISNEERCQMISMAIEDNPHLALSYEELNREGATYTAETLSILTTKNIETRYYFIMGADSLFHIETWKDPATIFSLCHIIVAPRMSQVTSELESQIDYLMAKYQDASIDILNTPNLDISSHGIRKRVRQNQSIRYLLPSNVEEYIISNHLYCLGDEKNAGKNFKNL